MTLYEALDAFKDIRDTAITTESKRKIEPISEDWQSINTNMTLYYNTLSSGDTVAADAYIDEIITILNGYDLTVDLPIQFPLALSVFYSPVSIQVPVDEFGLNPNYTDAISTISVYVGGLDDSSNWTYVIDSSTNTTAVIQNTNEVKINALTADSGSVVVEASKSGYDTLSITVTVFRYYDAQSGLSINTYPSTILIPSDSNGDNPVLTDAISTQYVREGITDETANYTFAIQSQTNVTAVIQNDNEVKINAITADTGNVTVRASRSGRPDYDYDIPAQKQKKASVEIDPSSIDDETIGLNSSNEIYLKRDINGEGFLFGSLPDLVSLYDEYYTVTPDSGKYRYKSSTIRRAPSTDTNSGYSSLLRLWNTEGANSVSSFTVGNTSIGNGNVLEISEDDGNDAVSVTSSSNGTVGDISFSVPDGDITSEYVVGQKVLVYVKINTAETKGVFYYITGEITASVFTTITAVTFSTDFKFTDGIAVNMTTAILDGHKVRAVSYSEYLSGFGPVGSYGNKIIGDDNYIRGADNSVNGSNNSINEGIDNIIYGDNFVVNPANPSYSGVRGNLLIGQGSDEGVDLRQIRGQRNLVIANGNHNKMSHGDTNAYIVIGDYITIGDSLDPQTTGYTWGMAVGTFHQSEAVSASLLGSGGHASTSGEIVLSSSSGPNQKSLFMLEGDTSSTSPFVLETVTKALLLAVRNASESIQMRSSTAFMGTIRLSSTIATGGTFMSEARLQFSCDGSGNIINLLQETPYTGNSGSGVSGTISYNTSSLNELIISVTPSAATATKWVCCVEGTIMDI